MEVLGYGIFILVAAALAFLVFLMVYSALLYLTTAWAKVDDRTFGKAILSTFCGFLASFVISIFLGFVPLIGWLFSILAGIFIPALITQNIFHTTFTKALIAEILRFAIIMLISFVLLMGAVGIIGFEAIQHGLTDAFQQYSSGIFMYLG
ncbi:hypothetical protein K8T06_13360 [bacterium]|nr:hypothetical protein [bacterium]